MVLQPLRLVECKTQKNNLRFPRLIVAILVFKRKKSLLDKDIIMYCENKKKCMTPISGQTNQAEDLRM